MAIDEISLTCTPFRAATGPETRLPPSFKFTRTVVQALGRPRGVYVIHQVGM